MDPKSNFQQIKNHITFTASNEVSEIMLPLLNKHEIIHFNFFREYVDGSMIRLCSNGRWNEHYFKKGYILNKKAKAPLSYLTKPVNYFIWLTDNYPEVLIDSAVNFNVANGISIAERYENYIDYYCFGAETKNRAIINNFYLSNLDLLLKYGHYFKEKARKIIKLAEKDKINSTFQDIERFSNLFEKNILIEEDIPLSRQQWVCAKHLIKGNSVKEIGMLMNLSPRTVESYINTIKNKLNCKNKTELLLKINTIKETKDIVL